MFPKLLHQIFWNFKDPKQGMPIDWQVKSQKCKEMYKNWQHVLWNKRMANALIKKEFRWLWNKWINSEDIEKVDILRYAILFKYGGMYLDLDTDCLKYFDVDVYGNYDMIIGSTDMYDNKFLGAIYGVNNNILVSKPNVIFWYDLLRSINETNVSIFVPRFLRVSLQTGPYILQKQYKATRRKDKIYLYKNLNIGKVVVTPDMLFLHESKKSWMTVLDAVYVATMLFAILVPPIRFLKLSNTFLVVLYVLFTTFIVYLLCRKNGYEF